MSPGSPGRIAPNQRLLSRMVVAAVGAISQVELEVICSHQLQQVGKARYRKVAC